MIRLNTFSPAGWAIMALLGLALVVLAYCTATGPSRERAKVEAARHEANARALSIDHDARERAADARLADAFTNAALKEERARALQNLPDARPSDRRIALACSRLRDQGTGDAALPAACRSPR